MSGLIGQTLGNYRVDAFISAGGMAEVYRGVHKLLERPVAIKVMLAHFAADEGFRARFLQEGKAVASLSHPNIVEVYDFGEEGTQLYLVMELLTDGSLQGLLHRRDDPAEAWSLPLGLDLIRQAAEGLAYAHQRGMVHRDIKPDNLLLKREAPRGSEPSRFTLKISDFGLARLTEGVLKTATGLTMGTPPYMSPEQCQGVELDGRSDLYSLGVVLYQIATGALPFEVRSLSEAVYKHVYVDPLPPRQVRPEIAPDLERVILRCLAKKPADRFASAADLAHALAQTMTPETGTVLAANAPLPQSAAPDATVVRTPAHDGTPPELPSVYARVTAAQVRVLDGQGQIVQTAPLTGEGVTIGRVADNAIVLDDATISRHHARLDWDGERVMVTDLGSANGTLLANVRLLPQEAQVWLAEHWLRVGAFWLRLDLPTPAQARAAAETRPISAPVAGDGGRLRVALATERLTITPGQPTTVQATLANLGRTVDHLSLSVEGFLAAWVGGSEREVQLNPGSQTTVALTINVPRAPGSYAGDYPVTIRARSRQAPAESGAAEALWTILSYEQPRISITPARRAGRTGANYTLKVENAGNTPVRFVFSGKDDDQALHYRFAPPALTIDAYRDAAIPMRVEAPSRLLGRPTPRRFGVVAKTDVSLAPESSPAEFVHRALLPAWAILVPVALIALAVLLINVLKPSIATFSYSPLNPIAGQPLVLQWKVDRADALELEPGAIKLDPHQQGYIFPQGLPRATQVTLVARNAFGQTTKPLALAITEPTATATVAAPTATASPVPPTATASPEPNAPTIDAFTVTPTDAKPGDTVTVTWQVGNAESVNLDPYGTVANSGTQTFKVQGPMTFTLTATNKGKVTKRSLSLLVLTPTPLPTATATPAPTAAPTVAPTASPAGAGAAVPVPGTGGQTGAATTASAALTLSGLAVAPDASGANVFWVVSSGDNTVWRQPAKGDLKAITVGKNPAAIAVGSSGAWVANAGDGTVQRLNLQDGQPAGAPIRVGKNPRSLAIARDAAGNEAVWVANADDGTVQRIDAQSNTVGAPVTVGKGLDAVAVSQDAVWAASTTDNAVWRIPLKNGQPAGSPVKIAVGKNPSSLAVVRDASGKESIWVANGDDGTVQRIDAQSNTAAAPIAVGKQPSSLAAGADASGKVVLWVALAGDNTAREIDPATNQVGTPVPVDASPSSIAYVKGSFWVLSRTQPSIKALPA